MKGYRTIRRSQIDGDFEGFDDEVLFKLMDGSYWVQDEYRYWYHYAYAPPAEILQINGRYYIRVDGQGEAVAVREINEVVEDTIDGEFTGWDGDTEYRLTNGQVWKQTAYKYEYTFAYRPDVVIYDSGSGARMNVEGTSAEVRRVR